MAVSIMDSIALCLNGMIYYTRQEFEYQLQTNKDILSAEIYAHCRSCTDTWNVIVIVYVEALYVALSDGGKRAST